MLHIALHLCCSRDYVQIQNLPLFQKLKLQNSAITDRGTPNPPKKGADRISIFFSNVGDFAPHTPRLFSNYRLLQ